MDIQRILKESREIWGDKKLDLSRIIVRMGKVFGDICRWERDEKTTDRQGPAELKKELGNMIVSTIRWCDDLGYDPKDCVKLAMDAQKMYQKNFTKKSHV